MKFILKLFIFCIGFYYTAKFCESKTAGFTFVKIHSDLTPRLEWEVDNSPFDRTIFDQKFSYLGAGGQCYAFVSEDGKYVLKFFKHHLRRLPFWLKVLPLPTTWEARRKLQLEKRIRKLQRDFGSYKLAYEEMANETGLLFVHLNKTTDLNQTARIVDKLGIEHKLSLDRVEFILQKKATLAYSHLVELVEKGEIDKAKKALKSICNLILTRCEKGIYDDDAKIHRNFGFVDNEAILIDVGRLKLDPTRKNPSIQQEDLKETTYRLKRFLEELSPELADYLERLNHV